MSLKEIQVATHLAQRDGKLPSSPGECRVAAQLLLDLAAQTDISPPVASHTVLVWPSPISDPTNTNVHYAFRANSLEGTLYINIIQAPGFPLFDQITNSPPGRLSDMISTNEVV